MTTQELDLVLNHPEEARAGLADGMSVEQIVAGLCPGKVFGEGLTLGEARAKLTGTARELVRVLMGGDHQAAKHIIAEIDILNNELYDHFQEAA